MVFWAAVILIGLFALTGAIPQYLDDTNSIAWYFNHTAPFVWEQRFFDQAYNESYTVANGSRLAPDIHYVDLHFRGSSIEVYGVIPEDMTEPGSITVSWGTVGVAVEHERSCGQPFNRLLFKHDGFNSAEETVLSFSTENWIALDYAIVDTNSTTNGSSSTPSQSNLLVGPIVGIAVGVTVFLAAIAITCICVRRHRAEKIVSAREFKPVPSGKRTP
ncbi:hypothetical protein DL96DRAFT_1623598 [Flagelloscypha sp. PMI_526]|nr:hypothetical protein DL96DRAFT_1623598 [Flagelloscypha sp. PMI_526]